MLSCKTVDIEPTEISLWEARFAKPQDQAFKIKFNVKQIWSVKPSPMTFCTYNTVLSKTPICLVLGMDPVNHKHMRLLPGPAEHMRRHYKNPFDGLYDFKESLPFSTVPPGDGLILERVVTWGNIFPGGYIIVPPERVPQPGDAYDVAIKEPLHRTGCPWWNWGSLDDDLKNKKLISPRSSRRSKPSSTEAEDEVRCFGYGPEDRKDGDGATPLANLIVHYDTTPQRIQFKA